MASNLNISLPKNDEHSKELELYQVPLQANTQVKTQPKASSNNKGEDIDRRKKKGKRPLIKGGYGCKFVKEPKQLQTECSICLQVLCKPEMISCCGNKFCHTCIHPILTGKKPCPLCKQAQFSIMADKQLERTLNGLEVYCTHQDEGCKWRGELGRLDKHFNLAPEQNTQLEGCEYVDLKCTFCQKDLLRQNMDKHMNKDCPQFEINCNFNHAGCEAKVLRKDLQKHLEDNIAYHMSLMADRTHQMANENAQKVDQVETLLNELRCNQKQQLEDKVSKDELRRELNNLRAVNRGPKQNTVKWIGGCLIVTVLVMIVAVIVGKDGMTLLIHRTTDPIPHEREEAGYRDVENKMQEMFELLQDDIEKLKRLPNEDSSHEIERITKEISTLRDSLEKVMHVQDEIMELKRLGENFKELRRGMDTVNSKLQTVLDIESEIKTLQQKIAVLVKKDELNEMKQKIELELNTLKQEIALLKQKVASLPGIVEIQQMVFDQFEKHRPPPPPPPGGGGCGGQGGHGRGRGRWEHHHHHGF